MDYPQEWNQLPKHERKKKLKELRRQTERKTQSFQKVRNIGLAIVAIVVIVAGFKLVTQKTPEQIEFEQKKQAVSLEGKVKEFPIEGRDHVKPGTKVEYKTNPPTSGEHLDEAENWDIYAEEIDDKAAVHNLEHGGIWISYKDIDEETKKILEEIGRENSQSVIVSPRAANEVKIAVASWGKMMKLDEADKALIQKYIDTYKNQSPEKLAR